MNPPAEPLHLYLLGGQSNMAGFGPRNDELPEELHAPLPAVPIFCHSHWGDLRPGLGHEPGMFGPEIAFGRKLHDALPQRRIALIKFAASGTNLFEQWRPAVDSPTAPAPGEQYQHFLETVAAALRALDADTSVVFDGMIWMQGESDATDETMARAYRDNLSDFIQRIRTVVETPDLPFALGLIAPFPKAAYYEEVVTAQQAAARVVPNVIAFPTDDLPKLDDALHYDTQGALQLGSRFAEHLLQLTPPADPTSRPAHDFALVKSVRA
jgi:hypothetical protein